MDIEEALLLLRRHGFCTDGNEALWRCYWEVRNRCVRAAGGMPDAGDMLTPDGTAVIENPDLPAAEWAFVRACFALVDTLGHHLPRLPEEMLNDFRFCVRQAEGTPLEGTAAFLVIRDL